MRVRDEADMAARIAASMAGPCPTVAYVPRAVLCADRDETNCRNGTEIHNEKEGPFCVAAIVRRRSTNEREGTNACNGLAFALHAREFILHFAARRRRVASAS